MRQYIILLVVAMFMAACSMNDSISISGTIAGASAKDTVYLKVLGGSEVDTIPLSDKGAFKVSKKINIPQFYALQIGREQVSLLVHPSESVVVNAQLGNVLKSYSLEGSEDSEAIRSMSLKLREVTHLGDSLNRLLVNFENNRNIVNIHKQFEWIYLNAVDSLKAFNVRFLDGNPESLASIYALYQTIAEGTYLFNDANDLKYFQRADSVFYKKYPTMPYVQALHQNVILWTEQSNLQKLNRMLNFVGSEAPDFTLSDVEGKKVALSSLRGKVVVLSFWASWSAESREVNQSLKETYNKYHSQGVEVLQVSLDKDKEAWLQAIQEDELEWTNLCDFQYFDSEAAKLYDVENVPETFLIDKKGEVLAKGLRGQSLDDRINYFLAVEGK